MDNVPETGEYNDSRRGMSRTARSALSSVFAFAAAFCAAYFFGAGYFAPSALVFFASSFVMTLVFSHHKGLLFTFVPFVIGYLAVLLPGVDRILALIAISAVLLFSATVSVLILRRAEKFYVFLFSSALFFIVFSGLVILLFSGSGVSVTAAVERIYGSVKAVILEVIKVSEQNGLPAGSVDAGALSVAITALAPAAVMIASMISSLVFIALFTLATRIAGTRELLLTGGFTVPRPFAVIYIIVTILSFLTAVFPDPWSYAVLNIDYVMMAIFAVAGIKSFFRSSGKRRAGSGLVPFLIVAAVSVFFFGGTAASVIISVMIPVLSYIGAFRSLRPAKGKGSDAI